jgi:hypothetical protein
MKLPACRLRLLFQFPEDNVWRAPQAGEVAPNYFDNEALGAHGDREEEHCFSHAVGFCLVYLEADVARVAYVAQ